jgi:hypothetical protein
MATIPSTRPGPIGSLVALGAAWSALSAILWLQGAEAPAVLLPVAPRSYYGAQALFVAPWLGLLAAIFALVAAALARAMGGAARPAETWRALVPIWSLSLLVLFVLPDLAVVLALGREHLPRMMRLYAPLAPVAIVVLATRAVRRLHRVSAPRAAAAVVVALVAQASVGAVLLR